MSESQAQKAHSRAAMITAEELEDLVDREGPFVELYGFETEVIGHGHAVIRLPYRVDHIRPGGTIAGPAMMALADWAVYVAVLGAIGPVELAVTTSLNINFLRKPADKDLLAEARLIKLGKRLAVGDVSIHPEGDEEMCAHVTATYSIPPR